MRDKVIAGFIAGLAGGLVMNLLDQVSYFIGIAQVIHPDWATALILGTRTTNLPEFLFGLLMQLFHAGVMGIVYTVFIDYAGREYRLFKGVIYGISVFVVTQAITVLLYTPAINPLSLNTALSNVITSGVYGLVLAQTYHALRRRNANDT